ncbi:MAG TPA: HAMP domain-containing sensor histidine kinase [Solirubrobacteraceae bacterium]|nr:HAMP domain-containing sensor histidine kinase [Solirubrobacteraceae bacterium]
MSLRLRMGLAAGLAVAIAVVAVVIAAYAGTSSELRGQLDHSLRSLSSQVIGAAPPGNPGGQRSSDEGGKDASGAKDTPETDNDNAAPLPPPYQGTAGKDCDEGLGFTRSRGGPAGGAAGVVTLVLRNGTTCAPGGQQFVIPVSQRFKEIAATGHGTYFTDMDVKGTEIRVLATGLGPRGALLVALPFKDVHNALARTLVLLLIIAAAGIALAAFLGVLVARAALAPIARFTRQTERIAANPDRLDRERLDVHGGDELARLAHTFNRTLDALEASVQAQRNLVADASHELRTPIATIRANIQLMRDEKLLSDEDRDALRRDIIEELDELTALVGDVVELARGTKLTVEPGEVRVDEIVNAAVDRARRRAPEMEISASLAPTLVYGEGDRIARAVSNLLDNAAKYAGREGPVEVSLQDGVLEVRDHGPGFKDEDLPFVFDRFHRARDARSKAGSGLGLAIVRQAAEAHGGFVEATNAPGGGALMRVSFGQTLELDEASLPGAAAGS